ncbi:MAG: ATP-dependent helicase HrpA, partial [Cellvibrionaceae bacterium]
ETNRLYAHTVALIEPQWLISVAGHLLIYRHDQPHYQPHSGQVMAYEQISLYGLVVSDKKRVSYAQINLAESRELFIRAALVEGEYAKHPRMRQQLQKAKAGEHFFLNQQRLIEEITALEAKSRKRDILVDDEILFDFYDRLVPAEIVNLTGFEHWRKHAEEQQKNLLHLDKAQLMLHQAADVTGNLFPDHLEMGDLRFRLVYQFDPVHRDDGVTLRVPVSALPLLSENRLQWLVPGFLAEKITALIKALPKTWRKKFAPVPATVAAILPNLKPCGRALVEVLAEQLFRHRGVQVPASVWGEVEFDDFYRMNIHIVDERGTFIDSGRDLPELQQRYRSQIRDRLAQTHNELEQQGLKTWSFGALPETYQLRQKDLQVRVYPGLKDRGDAVDIHLFDNIEDAAIHTLGGSVRLALLSQAQTIRYLKKHLLRNNTLSLSAVAIGDRAQVIDDIITAAVRQTSFAAVNSADTLIRREEIFQQQVKATCHQWVSRAEALEKLLLQVLSVVVEIKKTIKQSKNALATAWAAADIQQQLDGLFYQGFLYETLYEWFAEYPRYLQAILIRLEKVPRQANKDRVIIEEIESLWLPYRAAVDTEKSRALFNRELICYRWMIEEFRVSEFAQILGTRLPVSLKRLKRQWELC